MARGTLRHMNMHECVYTLLLCQHRDAVFSVTTVHVVMPESGACVLLTCTFAHRACQDTLEAVLQVWHQQHTNTFGESILLQTSSAHPLPQGLSIFFYIATDLGSM